MEKHFKLYTWQNPDWDITKEKYDPSMSLQSWGKDTWDRLQLIYEKLKLKIGTLDVVHCFAEYEHWNHSEIRRLWELDVPSSAIFNFLNDKIWDAMVKNVLNNIRPDDIIGNNVILEISEGIKILSTGTNIDITPLVLVPLSRSIQVISNDRFNKGNNYHNAKYEDLPTSISEAKKCREERPRKGAWKQQ